MRKIGFTGTQEGMSARQQSRLADILRSAKIEFHHGDCIGADEQAHDLAVEAGCDIVIHPPIDEKKRAFCHRKLNIGINVTVLHPAEYLARNLDIVLATEEMVAAPKSGKEELRSGTWATIRAALRNNRPLEILPR